MASRDEAERLYDERFCRMWECLPRHVGIGLPCSRTRSSSRSSSPGATTPCRSRATTWPRGRTPCGGRLSRLDAARPSGYSLPYAHLRMRHPDRPRPREFGARPLAEPLGAPALDRAPRRAGELGPAAARCLGEPDRAQTVGTGEAPRRARRPSASASSPWRMQPPMPQGGLVRGAFLVGLPDVERPDLIPAIDARFRARSRAIPCPSPPS